MQWDDSRIRELLLTLKAAMDDELATIVDLDDAQDGGTGECRSELDRTPVGYSVRA